jgi:hypothetical protein
MASSLVSQNFATLLIAFASAISQQPSVVPGSPHSDPPKSLQDGATAKLESALPSRNLLFVGAGVSMIELKQGCSTEWG